MEKLLFRKVEIWVLLLIFILGLVGLVFFGAIVRSEVLGFKKYGIVGRVAIAMARFPSKFKLSLESDERLVAPGGARFEGKSGWEISDGAQPMSGYLLLSRFDGERQRHVVELVDLATLTPEYQWWPDSETLLEDAVIFPKHNNAADLKVDIFRAVHPLMLPNGDLIIKDHGSPAVRVDTCSRKVWMQDESPVHHSTELGPDGNIWMPSHIEPVSVEKVKSTYIDDGVMQMSPEGAILQNLSATQMLLDNGYRYLVFGTGAAVRDYAHVDPLHVNDVQPVIQDGPHWKKGDIFISMRHISTVMLYRPSTNRILWLKTGPWSSQHDVDIIDDHTIGVFNNNVFDMGYGGEVIGTNQVVYYDFDTHLVSAPFSKVMESENIKTLSEGLFDVLPDGSAMIEEENSGRIVIAGTDGTVRAEFINRAPDGKVYHLGWSRYIPRAEGDAVMANLAGITCADKP